MLSVKSKATIPFTSKTEAEAPIVLFDLESLGVNGSSFLDELRGSFENLEWDYYDVRREQLGILQSHCSDSEVLRRLSKPYYGGSLQLDELLACLPTVRDGVIDRLLAISPYRRRSTARLQLVRDQYTPIWNVHRLPNESIAQQVTSEDYRSMPRGFKETSVAVLEHPQFQTLIQSIGDLVTAAQQSVQALELTCWQTGIVATPHRAGSNSPEGIHQDGADYIISALVVDRENIKGGTSRVFGPDKSTEHLEVTLGPGQGIFQADAGSPLWHDVTPVAIDDPEEGTGVRNLFGFDINVIK